MAAAPGKSRRHGVRRGTAKWYSDVRAAPPTDRRRPIGRLPEGVDRVRRAPRLGRRRQRPRHGDEKRVDHEPADDGDDGQTQRQNASFPARPSHPFEVVGDQVRPNRRFKARDADHTVNTIPKDATSARPSRSRAVSMGAMTCPMVSGVKTTPAAGSAGLEQGLGDVCAGGLACVADAAEHGGQQRRHRKHRVEGDLGERPGTR